MTSCHIYLRDIMLLAHLCGLGMRMVEGTNFVLDMLAVACHH